MVRENRTNEPNIAGHLSPRPPGGAPDLVIDCSECASTCAGTSCAAFSVGGWRKEKYQRSGFQWTPGARRVNRTLQQGRKRIQTAASPRTTYAFLSRPSQRSFPSTTSIFDKKSLVPTSTGKCRVVAPRTPTTMMTWCRCELDHFPLSDSPPSDGTSYFLGRAFELCCVVSHHATHAQQ